MDGSIDIAVDNDWKHERESEYIYLVLSNFAGNP